MKTDHSAHRRGLLALPMYLWALAFVGVALLYIIGLSFLEKGEALEVTGEITLSNYSRLWDPKYGKVLWLSLRLAGLTTLIPCCLAIPLPISWPRPAKNGGYG